MLREILNKSPHHWEDRKKAEKDFYYLQSLKKELIPSVAIELNRLHKTNHSDRAWDLMIGYWLSQFLAVSFDRWFIIKFQMTKELKGEIESTLKFKMQLFHGTL